jgi:hypothetical protein
VDVDRKRRKFRHAFGELCRRSLLSRARRASPRSPMLVPASMSTRRPLARAVEGAVCASPSLRGLEHQTHRLLRSLRELLQHWSVSTRTGLRWTGDDMGRPRPRSPGPGLALRA